LTRQPCKGALVATSSPFEAGPAPAGALLPLLLLACLVSVTQSSTSPLAATQHACFYIHTCLRHMIPASQVPLAARDRHEEIASGSSSVSGV
jgi:hypothetical protein